MRPIWTGGISFGLIFIPVKLYSASKPRELNFRMLSKKDNSPVRYIKVSSRTGNEVSQDDIVRGYEFNTDNYVVLDDQDFKNANLKKTKSIEIDEFVDKEDISLKYIEKPYFVEPEEGAEKTYLLLLRALKETNKAGIAKFVLKTKEQLGLLAVEDDMLMLYQIRFNEELHTADNINIPKKGELSEKEIDLAVSIINKLSGKFKPDSYHDSYSEDLKDLIEAKVRKHKFVPRGEEPTPTSVPDLMQKLKESLELAKH